ncbi:hypothetical protein [Lactobacillus equicursoris]|uniref:hypothetical protein n=1 Tax=Lactobacillus equicursoris TaxID=420645 RepID=UPI003991E10A
MAKWLREYFEKYESSVWTLLVAVLCFIPVSKFLFHHESTNIDSAFWAVTCSLISFIIHRRSTIVVRFENGGRWDNNFNEIQLKLSEGKAVPFKIYIKLAGFKEETLVKHSLIFDYPKDITVGFDSKLDQFVDSEKHKIVIPLSEIGNNEVEFSFLASSQNKITSASYKTMNCSSDFKFKSVKIENKIIFYWE